MNPSLTLTDVNRHTELSIFRVDLSREQVDGLCRTAIEKRYAAITMPSSMVGECAGRLEDSGVGLIAQIGFPHGLMHGDSKRFETELCVDDGAQEFEVVANLRQLQNGDEARFLRELRDIVEAAEGRHVRVALKWSGLSDTQREHGARLVLDSGAHYLSTGLGFGEKPDDEKLIAQFQDWLGEKFWIKAAQPLDDEGALICLNAGAQRLGRVAVLS